MAATTATNPITDSSWPRSPSPDPARPTLEGIERTDEDLVAAANGGDRSALDLLLSRHYDRLYAICRRLAGNDADAADACQEALMAIVRGLERFEGSSTFKTWSYRVATNACLDELRRRGRRPDPGLPEHEHADDEYLGGRTPRDPGDTVSAQIDVVPPDRGVIQARLLWTRRTSTTTCAWT